MNETIFGKTTMKINELLSENLNELFGLFGDGDPLSAPEWMDEENEMLWQQKNPTTKDKRLVTQLQAMERLVANHLQDMANQQLKSELEMLESVNENFLRNLVGDVRNAFKPGIAVTPNMIQSMETALAKLEAGQPVSDRERQMFDTFLNTTMAREIKKTFGVDITETTSAGAVAAVAAPVGGLVARQPRNSDGTARNALDSDNNLMGGPKKKKKKTSSNNR